MEYNLDDFIGVFDGAFDKEYCDSLIDKFEFLSKMGKTKSRAEFSGSPQLISDNNIYFPMLDMTDTQTMGSNFTWLQEFNIKMWECYSIYTKKYGTLNSVQRHQLNPDVKIQKTKPSEGYHVWHCENGNLSDASRLILVMLYLNDIEEGGETEFLYQSRRVQPKMGRLVFRPTSFTHTHRGKPPLKGNKDMLNGWLQYYHEIS